MNRDHLLFLPALLALLTLSLSGSGCSPPPRSAGAMSHEAYVWQRAWRPEVAAAVRAVGGEPESLGGVVALAAEVDLAEDRPKVVRVELDYPALAALTADGASVGLALRIGSSPTPFAQRPEWVGRLARVAAGLVGAARAQGVEPAELQIDHDCPTARLTDCALVVAAVREAVAPLSTVFTALPTWLDDPRGFERLAEAADGFVLQVHGLSMSGGAGGEPTLCDPPTARRAVKTAARFRRPFRVALPTFTHLVAVDVNGRVRDVLSEDAPPGLGTGGPRLASVGGPGLRWRAVAADPAAMAELVRGWTASRPEALAGVLWYRLPVAGDRLNWTPASLGSVIAGRAPERELGLRIRRAGRGLVEVDLVNRGVTREPPPERIALSWGDGRLLAADGLAGYRFDASSGELRWSSAAAPFPQPAGERRTVAWLRFAGREEVRGDIVR